MTMVRLTIQLTLDNSNSLWFHSDNINSRNIDLFGGDSDSESQCQGGDFDQQTFFPSESLGQPPPPPPHIHFDRCSGEWHFAST